MEVRLLSMGSSRSCSESSRLRTLHLRRPGIRRVRMRHRRAHSIDEQTVIVHIACTRICSVAGSDGRSAPLVLNFVTDQVVRLEAWHLNHGVITAKATRATIVGENGVHIALLLLNLVLGRL